MSTTGWVLVAVLVLADPVTAGPYNPSLRFRTHRTPHFQIHHHQGEDALAARLASIAEATHVRLSSAWALPGTRMTHVVLVDQTDLPNGSATVVPWNAIVIYPVPPSGAATIGNTDDWLEYIFTHEYAHILHLDQSRGWARVARALFGRSAIAFPNLTLPLWQIEGLATLTESDGGAGRLHAGDFREIVDAAARAGRPEPLDRVNGGLVDWPSGQGWYAYGARFHQYLARSYGVDRLHELYTRTAGRLPFLTAGAFRRVYGKSLGGLWQEFQAATAADSAPALDSTATPITRLGFLVDGPREAPDGAIYFTATDAHRLSGIYRLRPGADVPVRVVSRYGGDHLSVTNRDVLFDQLEIARGAALVSDLYLHDFSTGRTRRLTRGARLSEADRSPDGTRIAAVQAAAGARHLVVLDATSLLAASNPTASPALPVVERDARDEVVYATPRWSPNGRLLAVERRRRGGPSTIVVLDSGTLRQMSEVAASAGGRVVNPAWTADGASLYFAASDGDAPFESAQSTWDQEDASQSLVWYSVRRAAPVRQRRRVPVQSSMSATRTRGTISSRVPEDPPTRVRLWSRLRFPTTSSDPASKPDRFRPNPRFRPSRRHAPGRTGHGRWPRVAGSQPSSLVTVGSASAGHWWASMCWRAMSRRRMPHGR